MPRKAYEDEINENSTQEHLELCLIEATRTSDTNVQKAAARARAEISRRERQERRDMFNAESRERVRGSSDTGKWWVEGDRYCRKWNSWAGAEKRCFFLYRDGNKLRFYYPETKTSENGHIAR